MVGPKLNDGALLIADGRPTTKATAKYVRGSASKVRAVLDLIRGLDVGHADEVLRFTTRDAAIDVRKVLASAVANAVHNDEQDADELFVLACYADEGPTMRRFRPRARGRATRIRKRSCHITVVVARLSDDRLEVLQNRQQTQSASRRTRRGGTAQSRRDRVERSRTRAQSLRAGATDTADDTSDLDTASAPDRSEDDTQRGGAADETDTPAADEDVVDTNEVVVSDVDEELEDAAADQAAADIADSELAEDAEDAEDSMTPSDAVDGSTVEAVELPAGAVEAPEDGSVPDGYPIKGNANSMLYHQPGGRYYDVTIAEVFFDTPEHAEAAGYSAPATEDNS